MKVVFLDIDGVLRDEGSHSVNEHESESVALLKQITNDNSLGFNFYEAEIKNRDDSTLGIVGYSVLSVVYEWDKKAISFLKKLLEETGSYIVITSSWRFYGDEFLRALLSLKNLDKFYIDSTIHIDFPDSPAEKTIIDKWRNWKQTTVTKLAHSLQKKIIDERSVEIYEYINRFREIDSYVIIDDSYLGIDENFVKVQGSVFGKREAELAKKILNKPVRRSSITQSIVTQDLLTVRQYLKDHREIAKAGWCIT